jgi:flagellar biogenesis protein FliO
MPSARAADGNLLRIVARTALSPKHSLSLVHLGRRLVLVGVGGDRLTTLCEVSDPQEVAELMVRTVDGRRDAGPGFDALLAEQADEATRHSTAAAPSRGRSLTDRSPRAIHDLLHRLRALQNQ